MSFINSLDTEANYAHTLNGQKVHSSTGNAVLDLFSKVGAIRGKDVFSLVERSFSENELLTMKTLFYARDIRGGLGERKVFRDALVQLANNKITVNAVRRNLHLVPEFGRWDDLLPLLETPLAQDVADLFKMQIVAEWGSGVTRTLMAKWLPSVNASSKQTRKYASILASLMGMTKKDYKNIVSALRKDMNLVEQNLSKNEMSKIEYSHVPSKAMLKYKRAFERKDGERWEDYKSKLESGEVKVNAGAVYPYDIFNDMGFCYGGWRSNTTFSLSNHNPVAQAMWDSLPNYVDGANVLVMADTSGSMQGLPMLTSVSLAVYFAERNVGEYHNKFMTFSRRPYLVTLNGNTLQEKVACIPSIVENTDLNKAMEVILDTAVKNNIPSHEMPVSLVVISDMQFDHCSPNFLMEHFKALFNGAGYELPNIIFWNVNAYGNSPARQDESGVQLVSGHSPSVFKSVLSIVGKTPYEAMIEILSDERYSVIK